ncbi:MAG: peroxidase [Acidimicrobiia bacterium]
MVDRFAVDWHDCGLDPATMALLDFAELLTDECSAVDAEAVGRLKGLGFDDRSVSSCVQVVAYFNYINRIAEGLGVSLEDWLQDDGRPRPV